MDFLENGFSMQVNQMSALALAFVGDSVFDLFIRGRLATRKKESAHQLHMKATRYVKQLLKAKLPLHFRTIWMKKKRQFSAEAEMRNPQPCQRTRISWITTAPLGLRLF